MGDDTNVSSGKKFSWSSFFFGGCLMLVVLILVAIAIPDFLRFGAKAKQSEAKRNLGAIFTSQVAYFREFNEYGSTFQQINWAPGGQNMYAYYCGKSIIKNNKGQPIDFEPKRNWPFKVVPATSETAFTCMAIANMDSDYILDVWTIDNTKQLKNIVNDVIE